MWRELLDQGISLVALKVPSEPEAKPVIAGVNILIVMTAEDEDDDDGPPEVIILYLQHVVLFSRIQVINYAILIQLQSKSANEVLGAVVKFSEEADVLKKYGVDKYLNAIGLSVDPAFRGQGLGEELLRTR